MKVYVAVILSIAIASASGSFSPLSTFYDNYVSTKASFYSGKSFGPGCARGGSIPNGFIAVAMNGQAVGLPQPVQACGLCLHIKGPAPVSTNPQDNEGVTGEYFAYVYDVCPDCNQQNGLQLGVPGNPSAQTDVTWRAIPCPAATSTPKPVIFFEGASATKARFQVRGLSAPITAASVAGQVLAMDGPFFVHVGGYPFVVEVETGLGEVVSINVSAYRKNGVLSDLIKVDMQRAARQTNGPVPSSNQSDSLSGSFGNGHITTVSGPQTRTVITTNQANRQIISILTSPNEQAAQAQQTLSWQRGFGNKGPLVAEQPFPTRSSLYDSAVGPAVGPRSENLFGSSGPGVKFPEIINDPIDRALLEAYLASKSSTLSPVSVPPTTPAPTNATTPAPTNATTPAPTSAPTPAPTNATTPAPTNATTPAPTNATTPAPTSVPTPAPTNATTPAPTNATTPAPTNATTPAPTNATTPPPTNATTPDPTPVSTNVTSSLPIAAAANSTAAVTPSPTSAPANSSATLAPADVASIPNSVPEQTEVSEEEDVDAAEENADGETIIA